MDVSDVGARNGYQYGAKTVTSLQEDVKNTPDSEKRDLGVIVEFSMESQKAQKLSEEIKQNGKNVSPMHRVINGDSAKGMVSFYGASVTKEQSEKLQSVIRDLEQQGFVKATPNVDGNYQAGDEALGYMLEPGTYAQLGLKVSQLAYVCKEIGLSDEVSGQITSTYGKQVEEKINKVSGMAGFVAEQIKVVKEKFYEEHGMPNYKKGVTQQKDSTGKDIVEIKKEQEGWNRDIYKMFANLDVSSKENFQSSFDNAMVSFEHYFAAEPIEGYNGTRREQMQLNELLKRFNNFI